MVHVVGEPAEPVGGVGTHARVGVGGDQDLVEEVDTQGTLINVLAGDQASGIL
jgi:hypothetical protein